MQELNMMEVSVVGGGAESIYSEANIKSAERFTKALGFLGAAFAAGWAVGQWLNENTNIQQNIADSLVPRLPGKNPSSP